MKYIEGLKAGHVDQVLEFVPGRFIVSGWCTDIGRDASLCLKHQGGSFDVLLGTSRVSRPDVCKELGISHDFASRLGFFATFTKEDDLEVESISLAGNSMPWTPEKIGSDQGFFLICRCIEALNWGVTPLEELGAFLHGELGVALVSAHSHKAPLLLPDESCPDASSTRLVLYLPACADLVFLQLWRLALQPVHLISLVIDARLSAFGDPDQISAEILRIWPSMNLPLPNIMIADLMDKSSWFLECSGSFVGIDGRQWLLAPEPWWEKICLSNLNQPKPYLSAGELLGLGFEMIDWPSFSFSQNTADQWAWQQEIDQWLQKR